MDGNYVDLTALNNYKDEFTKESKQTASSTLNTVQDSYLAKSSDPYVGKMYTNIESEVQNIEKGSGNIITYWDSYTNDVQGVDKALASDNKATTEINSPAVSTYVNQLPDLGTVDTPDTKFDPLQKAKDVGTNILNTMGIGTSGGTAGVNKSKDETADKATETNNAIKNLVSGLTSLNVDGQLLDSNAFNNLLNEGFLKFHELTTEFLITSDENLPAATQALTDFLQTTGIFSQKSALELNELVNAYVSEGVKATLQGAAEFSANFDYETVGKDYIAATTTLAQEATNGAQAGLKTGFSNFDFGPIIASAVAGMGTMAAGIATNPTNLGSYLNPIVDISAATINQAIPALSAGATAYVANFNTGKVVDGYIKATINAAKITAEAARLGLKEGISSVDVGKLSSVTGSVFNNMAVACAETYAQLMDTFSTFANSLNIPQIPGFPIGGGSSGDGSGWGIGKIDWSTFWQNPSLNFGNYLEAFGLPTFDVTQFKDIADQYDKLLDSAPIVSDLNKAFNSIPLDDLPNSGFKNVGEYREAVKGAMVIENANFATLLPHFLFAARNTIQMGAYGLQMTYDRTAVDLNNIFNKALDMKDCAQGNISRFLLGKDYNKKNPSNVKVVTSIGDSCESGWGLEDYNARGQYIVANENVNGSAPMLVGEALGADVHQYHMPGARTTEVLQILNPLPLNNGWLNKASIPLPTDILGLFDPNHQAALTNTPLQVAMPWLYGFGDAHTDTIMAAMTPQYSSEALVSYREDYIKSIQESDVVVLDIGMNDYWVPLLGPLYAIAADGGGATSDLMKDMNDDPIGFLVKFIGNIGVSLAAHPDKLAIYGAMLLEMPYKWLADYFVNYIAIVALIRYYNPDCEIVLVGGYNPVQGWDLLPGYDDNILSYIGQFVQNFHDLYKRGIALFMPGDVRYADMRGVELQASETTFLMPSLDNDMYNPHPTQKGAYQQADKILSAIGAESPYKEEIKGDAGYYGGGEEDFFNIWNIHWPRKYVEAPLETYFGDLGKFGGELINTPLNAAPHSVKDIANIAGVNINN